jgi:3-oxoacyl-[acyl-carrier protein] reductase
MALRLAGKHAAVVGATGIIGSHIARAFANHGAVVSLLGRTAVDKRAALESQLQPVAQTTSSSSSSSSSQLAADTLPSSHQFIRLDVSNAAHIKSVFGGKTSTVC